MKKWNKPELAVVDIKETAKPNWSHYEKNGNCSVLQTKCPVADNNGYGKCKDCTYITQNIPTIVPTVAPTQIPTGNENILS